MKLIITMTFVALLAIASTGLAFPLDVYSIDDVQDPLLIQGPVHELGDFFPLDELIESFWTETDETSCFDGSDNPFIPNILVIMTNLTNTPWRDVHYVADPLTTITNFDGFIGNAGLNDHSEAFRIDGTVTPGINLPLLFESFLPFNEIFEPGETWEFIIQDFGSPVAFPAPFGSLGIASASLLTTNSSGSIIAVPEPLTLSLLALSGLAALIRRRNKEK